MKKRYLFIAVALALACGLIFINVPTKYGIDYKVYTYKMPLYIKIIEFVDRDYQYRRITNEITAGKVSSEDKVLAIFNWCVGHIKHKPEGLTVVDDHPMNIIIRGYGAGDQFEDIFTILCTYAGYESFYKEFKDPDKGVYLMSFVKMGDKWYPFSVSHNVYAVVDGHPASTDDILNNPELVSQFSARIPEIETKNFLAALKSTSFESTSVRTRGQSPFGRLSCYLKKLF